tara:strand:- start:2914 stop:3114 length:201 start_codon:yes stop_codon:yes gene_type:complete
MDCRYLEINIQDVDEFEIVDTYRVSLDGSQCIIELVHAVDNAMTKEEVQLFLFQNHEHWTEDFNEI